jgi:hypothetical protein
VPSFKYNFNDKVKDAEMGRTFSTYGAKINTCRILMGQEKEMERATNKAKT